MTTWSTRLIVTTICPFRVEDYTFFDQEDTQEDLAEVICMWSPM